MVRGTSSQGAQHTASCLCIVAEQHCAAQEPALCSGSQPQCRVGPVGSCSTCSPSASALRTPHPPLPWYALGRLSSEHATPIECPAVSPGSGACTLECLHHPLTCSTATLPSSLQPCTLPEQLMLATAPYVPPLQCCIELHGPASGAQDACPRAQEAMRPIARERIGAKIAWLTAHHRLHSFHTMATSLNNSMLPSA